MQVLPQCGHAVHEDAPEKVRTAYSDKDRLQLQLQCSCDLFTFSCLNQIEFATTYFISKALCRLLLGSRCSRNIYGPAQIH